MSRRSSAKIQRDLYLASRAVGDARAFQRGGLGALVLRLFKRRVHRAEIRAAKKGGIW